MLAISGVARRPVFPIRILLRQRLEILDFFSVIPQLPLVASLFRHHPPVKSRFGDLLRQALIPSSFTCPECRDAPAEEDGYEKKHGEPQPPLSCHSSGEEPSEHQRHGRSDG
ncbi:MAG TPA: hypothetical protein VLO11_02530 [Luteolibacter sp.]|nr:hypothetical protein [Luteolibacter sp.]